MAVVGGGDGGGRFRTTIVPPNSVVLIKANSFLRLPSSPTMLMETHYSFCRSS